MTLEIDLCGDPRCDTQVDKPILLLRNNQTGHVTQGAAVAREHARKRRDFMRQRRELARSRVESDVQDEVSASVSALMTSHSNSEYPANFGSAHAAAPQAVAETLEAAHQRRMEMLLEQRVEQVRASACAFVPPVRRLCCCCLLLGIGLRVHRAAARAC